VRYEGPAPALVLALKEQRRTVLAGVMAEMMAARLDPPPEGAVLVPVPLAPARELQRGFNQSALIAGELGRRWSRPVESALVRREDRARQRGAAPAARAVQVRGAFRAASRRGAARRVCLIDDVHTTGATLAAAAQALWLAGSREISARCFARAPARG
jgi:ComF family protein